MSQQIQDHGPGREEHEAACLALEKPVTRPVHSEPALTRCAQCSAPAVDTAVIVVDRRQLEVDLCEDHVRRLLLGARSLEPKVFSAPAREMWPR